MDLFGKLKDEVLAKAATELQAADELVEAGKLTNSFQVWRFCSLRMQCLQHTNGF